MSWKAGIAVGEAELDIAQLVVLPQLLPVFGKRRAFDLGPWSGDTFGQDRRLKNKITQ